MNPRKIIGAVALALLVLIALASRYLAGIPQEQWGPVWNIAYVGAVFTALVMALYDRKNLPEKVWDYNPKRGLFYFMLGWILFPIMMTIDALFGTEISLGGMLIGTAMMSVLVGIAGTFTENVGV